MHGVETVLRLVLSFRTVFRLMLLFIIFCMMGRLYLDWCCHLLLMARC